MKEEELPDAAGGASISSVSFQTLPLPTEQTPVDLHEPLLTADQVAELLGVPRSSIHEYARRLHGPLPSVSIGRHRRFLRADLERWLAGQRCGSPPS